MLEIFHVRANCYGYRQSAVCFISRSCKWGSLNSIWASTTSSLHGAHIPIQIHLSTSCCSHHIYYTNKKFSLDVQTDEELMPCEEQQLQYFATFFILIAWTFHFKQYLLFSACKLCWLWGEVWKSKRIWSYFNLPTCKTLKWNRLTASSKQKSYNEMYMACLYFVS